MKRLPLAKRRSEHININVTAAEYRSIRDNLPPEYLNPQRIAAWCRDVVLKELAVNIPKGEN